MLHSKRTTPEQSDERLINEFLTRSGGKHFNCHGGRKSQVCVRSHTSVIKSTGVLPTQCQECKEGTPGMHLPLISEMDHKYQ